MSANLHVDIGNTALFVPSISTATASGVAVVGQWVDMSNTDTFCNVYVAVGPCSGSLSVVIQTAPGPYDVPLGSNAFSGVIWSGGGPLSGSFTDPTSGLAQLPTWVASGGVLIVNSGTYTLPGGFAYSGTFGANPLVNGYPNQTLPFGTNPVQHGQGGFGVPTWDSLQSGALPIFCSGGIAFAAFQRPQQYARLVVLSGTAPFVQAGFVAQLDTTGSGGGQTQQPLTTFVNV